MFGVDGKESCDCLAVSAWVQDEGMYGMMVSMGRMPELRGLVESQA